MVDIGTRNADKISSLEGCITTIQQQIAVLNERAETTLGLVREIRDDQRSAAEQSTELIISHAQNVQRWEVYERDRARMEDQIKDVCGKLDERVDEIEDLAQNNRITIAKMLALGGSGGVIAAAAVEVFRFIVSGK